MDNFILASGYIFLALLLGAVLTGSLWITLTRYANALRHKLHELYSLKVVEQRLLELEQQSTSMLIPAFDQEDPYSLLRSSAVAATPGPWARGGTTMTTHKGCQGSYWELHSIMMAPEGKHPHWQAGFVRDQADADFIAQANPRVILGLLDSYRSLHAEVSHLRLAVLTAPGCETVPGDT
jgi:hypothetical protein